MDFEKILSATIRFSSFLGIRLIFFAIFAALLAPWSGYQNLTGDLVKSSLDSLQTVSVEYEDLLKQIGLEGVTTYFALFFTLVLIQLTFLGFSALGDCFPPSFRHKRLEEVEQEMVFKALERCRSNNLEYDRQKRVLDSAGVLHESVVDAWNLRNSTAQEIFSVSKGIAAFSIMTALVYGYVDLGGAENLSNIYYWLPIALFVLSVSAGFFLRNSRRGAHQELVRKLKASLEAELFVVFANVDFKRRPTISIPDFDGQWFWKWSILGSRKNT